HALISDLEAMRTQQDEFHSLVSLRSLSSFATILAAAEALHKSDRGPEALEWLAQWIRDLILVCVGGDREALVNGDRLVSLEEASRAARLDLLLDLHEDLGAMSRAASRNLNLQLALENTLLRLREALCMPTESRTAT
ncbi:MAG: DNA polymerase III subunit delta' C-terminal domain-containing protein, partial [Nitrospiraceae bacterium]